MGAGAREKPEAVSSLSPLLQYQMLYGTTAAMERWSDGAMSHVRQEKVGFGCLSWCCRESVPSTVSPSKRKSRSRIRGVETEATMIVTPHFAHDLFFSLTSPPPPLFLLLPLL